MNVARCKPKKTKWERVLWKKQDFPDNYVDDDFFRVHKKCVKISSLEAHYGSVIVTQEICSCLLLFSVFFGLSNKEIHPEELAMVSVVICLLAYLITRRKLIISIFSSGPTVLLEIFEELRVAFFTVVLTWVSTPLVKTLTESVSTDTIYATTVCLLVFHLGCHNYGLDASIVNATMSHNLGLFASVCIASRLDAHNEVFALTLVAVDLFTLMPSFRTTCMEEFGKLESVVLCELVFIATGFSIYYYLSEYFILFITGILICTLMMPAFFVHFQHYRQNIYGPWDEALIDDEELNKSET